MDTRIPADAMPSPVQRHPPERRQSSARSVMLYSCCCCCCCCLHSCGAAIGAALGGNYHPDVEASTGRKLPSSQRLYWSSLGYAVLMVLAAILPFMLMEFFEQMVQVGSRNAVGDLLFHAPETIGSLISGLGFMLLLFGPLFLLVASVVMALRIVMRQQLRARTEYWRQWWRITARMILGTLAGTGIMALLLGGLVALSALL